MTDRRNSILIVDDDPGLRKTLSVILEIKGLAIVAVGTGGAAIEQVQSTKFDVALIDLRLDDMTGLEILSRIKADSPETECILLTGFATQETAIQAVNQGAYSYMQKPFDLDQLLVTIQRAIETVEAGRALRESEERYRMLAENMSDTVWLMDMNLQMIYISPSVERLRGYTLDEINALSLDRQMTPESFDRAMQLFAKLNTLERPASPDQPVTASIELEFFKKDGSRIWSDNSFVLVRDMRQQPIGILGAGRDITERKHAEKIIQQHIAELQILYEIGIAISRLLTAKQIARQIIEIIAQKLGWHSTLIRLLDQTTNDMQVVGLNWVGLSEAEVDTQIEHFNDASFRMESGLSGWVIQNGRPVRSGDVHADERYNHVISSTRSGIYAPMEIGGQAIGSISVESDQLDAFDEQDERLLTIIANQAAIAFENARLYQNAIHTADQLDEANRFAQATIDALSEHICVLDESGTILAINRAWREFADANSPAPADYYQGTNYLQVCDTVVGEDLAQATAFAQGIRSVLRGESDQFCMEYACDAPDEKRWFEGKVVRFAGTGALRVVIAHEDITHRKQVEMELRDSHAELEQRVEARTAELSRVNVQLSKAMRSRDEFLANMSHELRSPLSAILGITESMEEGVIGPLNEKQQDYMRMVSESGRHLLALINDILDLSKIEAGYLILEMEDTPAEPIFQAALRLVSTSAQKKGLSVSITFDQAIESLHVDGRRIKQVLVNLLSNAIKFTPRGGQIGLEIAGDALNEQVSVTVWDTGHGIDAVDIPRLFQPFVQLDAGLDREYPGSGLGLALVAQIVRLHGGRVSVDSVPGEGSRFSIVLPWTPENHAPMPVASVSSGRSSQKLPVAGSLKGKILLIEDAVSIAVFLADYLTSLGYQVVTAGDGHTGIEEAKAQAPNLILLDIQMPGMNGFEAARQMRQEPLLEDTPIIALTALAMPGDRERCIEAGMNDYLSKPVSLKELFQVVTRYLQPPEEKKNEARLG